MAGDAVIPGLQHAGLHIVPGYTVDPATGEEDPTWRSRYFVWRDAVRLYRTAHQTRFLDDATFRVAAVAQYKIDPAFFITMWLVVEEPRGEDQTYAENEDLADWDNYLAPETALELDADDSPVLDFIPFAYQVELIQLWAKVNSLPYRLDVYISKARGIGVSYVIMAAAFWSWLFRPWRGIFLSDKLERADRPFDLSSMFGKVDLFLVHLPKHLMPKGFNAKSHRHRQAGMFKNSENGIGQLTAVATTPQAGRGDRARFSASDESAFQEHYKETHKTLEGTVRHRWGWSSESYQMGRQWQDTWQAAKKHEATAKGNGKRPLAMVIELDWFLNPYQDRAWYQETRERFVSQGNLNAFAVEYLRNPDAGYSTLIYPEVNRCPDTDEWWDPRRPLFCGVDPGVKGETALVFWQTVFPEGVKTVRWIDSYTNAGKTAEFYAHIVTGLWPKPGDLMYEDIDQFGPTEQYFIDWLAKVPVGMLRMYGDPAMAADTYGVIRHAPNSWVRRFVDETRKLRRAHEVDPPRSIQIWHKELYKRNRHHDRRTAMKEALVYSEFSRTDGAQSLKHAIGAVRLQEMTEKSTSPPGWIHDTFTHPTSAAEYGMCYETMKLTAGEVATPKVDKLPESSRYHQGVTARGSQRTPTGARR